jgi:hypothetical protein
VSAWAPADPALRFRLGTSGPASAAAVGTNLGGLTSPSEQWANEAKPWHPQSPLFAFGVLAALTFGFMAVSTTGGASVRVGKTVASVAGGVGVGSTK